MRDCQAAAQASLSEIAPGVAPDLSRIALIEERPDNPLHPHSHAGILDLHRAIVLPRSDVDESPEGHGPSFGIPVRSLEHLVELDGTGWMVQEMDKHLWTYPRIDCQLGGGRAVFGAYAEGQSGASPAPPERTQSN